MSQQRKVQGTIGEMYGWTTTKTSKIQKSSETCEETHNSQMDQQLYQIFGSSSDDDLDEETNEVEEKATSHSN